LENSDSDAYWAQRVQNIADLVAKKREALCRTVNQAMEDLIMEIAKEN